MHGAFVLNRTLQMHAKLCSCRCTYNCWQTHEWMNERHPPRLNIHTGSGIGHRLHIGLAYCYWKQYQPVGMRLDDSLCMVWFWYRSPIQTIVNPARARTLALCVLAHLLSHKTILWLEKENAKRMMTPKTAKATQAHGTETARSSFARARKQNETATKNSNEWVLAARIRVARHTSARKRSDRNKTATKEKEKHEEEGLRGVQPWTSERNIHTSSARSSTKEVGQRI